LNQEQVFSVAELARMTRLTPRHIRRIAGEIPGHFIKGKRQHRFRYDSRLERWVETASKPEVVEITCRPSGIVGGEVLDMARGYLKTLRATVRRAVLTPQEKKELARLGLELADTCRRSR